MEAGFYVLNTDLDNPKPDRRSRAVPSLPVWKQGMRVYVRPGEEGRRRGTIEFPDRTTVYFGGNDPDVNQGNVLLPHLVPAQFAIGQAFRDHQAEMSDVLALAYERELLGLPEIQALMTEIGGWDEEAYLAFRRKHWLK